MLLKYKYGTVYAIIKRGLKRTFDLIICNNKSKNFFSTVSYYNCHKIMIPKLKMHITNII